MCSRAWLFALSLFALSLISGIARSQENTKNVATSTAAPAAIEVRFTDGGYLRMGLIEDYLDLITAHGRLRIAIGDLRRIELATRVPEATLRQIDQAI